MTNESGSLSAALSPARRPSFEERGLFRSLLRRVAAQSETRAAVLSDVHNRCTYSDVPRYLEQIQSFLASQGVERNDCLVLEVSNSVRAALTLLALLDADFSFMAMPAAGRGTRAKDPTTAYPKFGRWILTVDTAAPTESAEDLAPPRFIELRPNAVFDPSATPYNDQSPRLFFKTSGSLGVAKLAVYTYGNFYRNALNAQKVRQFNRSHRIALPAPIFHVYGLGAAFLPGLIGGATIDLQDRSNVLKYFEREAEFQPNIAYVTPPFCEMLIRSRRKPRPYEFMIVSGDRISESTFARCEELHGTMINQYGATELGIVSASKVTDSFESRARSVGKPVEGVEYRIVKLADERGGGDCGELQIRHAYGFEGYVDLEGRTLVPPNAFDGDWYRTGDLASVAEDGTLTVLGRCDLSVNRDGVLLPVADVESRMRELNGIDEVAVVATEKETLRGRALVAFCVLGARSRASGAELRTAYMEKAPAFSVPDVVCVVPELPKLESGKIDRRALARLAEDVDLAHVDG